MASFAHSFAGRTMRRLGFLLLALLPVLSSSAADKPKWREVSPEDLAATTPTVDKDAGAEILLRELKVDNRKPSFVSFSYFVRIKVFDERGVEAVKSYRIDTYAYATVTGLSARVLQPDGTQTDLKDADIFTRNSSRTDDEKITSRSFAFPNLRPGCIVDFCWKEKYEGMISDALFSFSGKFPVRNSVLTFRPVPEFMCFFNSHLVRDGMVPQNNGWYQANCRNVQADPDEPYMPPIQDFQPWITMNYGGNKANFEPDQYWLNQSDYLCDVLHDCLLGSGRAVRKKAHELTDGITDPTEKLKRLYQFCTHEIVNLEMANCGYSASDIAKMRANKDAVDTLKRRRGTGADINFLFIALAKEAGFEVNTANVNDRSSISWNPKCLNHRTTPIFVAAVRNGDHWEFFSPGVAYVPFGMLASYNEGTVAVLGNTHGEKKAVLETTPFSPAAKTQFHRDADLTLDEDGTLHGKVVFTYSGHRGRGIKRTFGPLSADERFNQLKSDVRGLVPNAEISEVEFINVTDPDKDPEIHFTLSVPGYADCTNERIVFQPSVFEKSSLPVFTKEKRVCDIHFDYAWESIDTIRITYPASFEIEPGEVPSNIVDTPTLTYLASLARSKTKPLLVYSRTERINVPSIHRVLYPEIKQFFDAIYGEDHRVTTLRRKADPAGANVTAPAANTTDTHAAPAEGNPPAPAAPATAPAMPETAPAPAPEKS